MNNSVIIEREEYIFSLENNQINLVFKTDSIDLDIVNQILKDKVKNIDDNDYPGYVELRSVKKMDGEARRRLKTDIGHKNVSACAVVINSKIQEVVMNFFTLINKPRIPVKAFTSEKKAKEWLSKYGVIYH